MRRLKILIIVLLLFGTSNATVHRYSIGFKGGMSTLSGGDDSIDKFTFQKTYGMVFGIRLKESLSLDFDYSYHKNYNDSLASSSWSFGGDKANATMKWKANRLGMTFTKFFGEQPNRFNLSLGLGGGVMLWKMVDPVSDTALEAVGLHGETVDYVASELFFIGQLNLNIGLSSKWTLVWGNRVDYLSGAGAEFSSDIKSNRIRWQVETGMSLKFSFGDDITGLDWSSNDSWQAPPRREVSTKSRGLDGDRDGVVDADDVCLDTPFGAIVDRSGCSVDSDGDGVADGIDDCPATDRRAAGYVDIFGCPVDSDFDGIPDYLDRCPLNPTGAHVDEFGCPIDSDADGVPDGLDDCPNTLYGMAVDKFGCIDLSMLSKPMVVNIDYPSGSFEIDPYNKERISDLSRILLFVKDVRLEINGYTDNIGTTVANQKLSEKRARRVRDYLVSLGVEAERIKVFGRGETNFVASNDTAEGRAKNRRIEIIFFK